MTMFLKNVFLTFRFLLPSLLALASPATVLATDKPNVVLFLVDDMGWADWQKSGDLNPHGSDLYETPNMERLARSGVVFANAYAASPVCSPTRAAIMTGKNPARSRITEWISGSNNQTANLTQPSTWVKNLPAAEVTLAESLKAGGYDTAFFGKWHLGQFNNPSADPLTHGFDLNLGGNHKGNPPGGYFAGTDGGWDAPGLESGYQPDDYMTDILTDGAVNYVQQNAGGNDPFFLMMSHYAVHTPKQAPQTLINKYNGKITQLQNQGVDLQGHTDATYAGMVEKMDESLGRILDRIEDPNGDGNPSDSVRDNTLILFASDNGGLFDAGGGATNNRPLRDGKGSLYEGGIRVPFIVSWTGNSAISTDRVEIARTTAHDIPTTILDAAGLLDDGQTAQTPSAVRDGVSILPALQGDAFDRGFQFWHYPHFSPQDAGSVLIEGGTFVSAVRKDDWKLIYFYDQEHYELYNLRADIGETNDVLDANPDPAATLSTALHNYLIEVGAQMPISRATGMPVAPPPPLIQITPGDFNSDGEVSLKDWFILKANLFRDVSSLLPGDAFALGDNDLSGLVDGFDFSEFKLIFANANGRSLAVALEGARIPEPSTLWIVLSGATFYLLRR